MKLIIYEQIWERDEKWTAGDSDPFKCILPGSEKDGGHAGRWARPDSVANKTKSRLCLLNDVCSGSWHLLLAGKK